jgi:hypothetical protein
MIRYCWPPYKWAEERRFLFHADPDATFFDLYGIARDDEDYIMETFPMVKRKNTAAYGSYRKITAMFSINDEKTEAMI